MRMICSVSAPKPILVATDLTPASEPALGRALAQARLTGAQLLVVHVIPLQLQHSVQCCVRVPKSGTLADVVQKLTEMNLPGTRPVSSHTNMQTKSQSLKQSELYFIAGELLHSRIRSFYPLDRQLDSLKDSDSVVFFQVRRPLTWKCGPNISSSGSSPVDSVDHAGFDPESIYRCDENGESPPMVRRLSPIINQLICLVVI